MPINENVEKVEEVLTPEEQEKERLKQLSKDFIKEQKTFPKTYRTKIVSDRIIILEKTQTTRMERIAVLEEDIGHGFQPTGITPFADDNEDDDEFGFEDLDLSMGLDLDLGLDLDIDVDFEVGKSVPDDNNEVIEAWKQRHLPTDKEMEEEEMMTLENFYAEDIEDSINDPYFEQSTKIKSQNVTASVVEPKDGEVIPYYKGKKVIYDYYRHSERAGEMTKNVYGEEEIVEDITLEMNKAINFERSEENLVNQDFTIIDNKPVTITFFRTGQTTLSEMRDSASGDIVKLTYIELDEDKEIEIEYNETTEDNIIPPRTLLPTLRYNREVLKSTATKERNEFRFTPYVQTVNIPKIERFKSFLNLDYVEHGDYRIVDTANDLIDAVDEMMSLPPEELIGYDAETQGLNARKWLKKPDLVVSHSFSWKDNQSIIVPIRMKYRPNIKPEEANEILKPVLEKKNILAHNGGADVRFLLPDGIKLNLVEDTMHLIRMIIPFIVKGGEAKGLNRALDTLCKRAFGYDMIDLNKYLFKPAGVSFDFSILNDDYLIYYGCPDTDLMRRLWKGLRPKLDPKREFAYKQLIEYSKAMATLSAYPGIGISEYDMREARLSSINTINKVQGLIYEITGETPQTLKLGSSAQISNYVFNKLGAPTEQAKVTDTGRLSADKHVMNALSRIPAQKPTGIFKPTADIYDSEGDLIVSHEELNKLQYPFCKLHRILADQTKDVTAFFNGILNNSLEGIYYPDFRVAQTDTYRDTDRVQITKDSIKNFLGAYDSEYAYISLDYATEEVRIAANRSTDMTLIRMLQNPEADSHTEVAAEMYNIEPYEVDSDIRGGVKACNFGIIYGIQVPSLTKQVHRTEFPTEDQLASVQSIYDLYKYKRAEMLEPLELSKQQVRENGWVENDLGAWMLYPQVIDVDNYLDQVFDFTKPYPPKAVFDEERRWKFMGMLMNRSSNFPIQSLAAFQLKESYITLYHKLIEKGYEDRVFIPLTVHDEVGIVYHKSIDSYELFNDVYESFYSEMEYLNKPKDTIAPLYIGVGFGTTWGNSKTDKAELPVRLQWRILEEYRTGNYPKLKLSDDVGKHFLNKSKSYMIERTANLLEDMIESKTFKRLEMDFRLKQNYFISKKVDELFGTIKSKEVNGKRVRYNDLDMYIDLICKYMGYDKSEFKIIDGEEPEENKPVEENKITEFYFEPQLHERIHLRKEHIEVDIRGLVPSTLKSLLDYLWTLEDDSYHSKQVMVFVGMDGGIKDVREVEGLRILGVPADFSAVVNHILYTGKFEGDSTQVELVTEPQDPLLLFDHSNQYMIFDTARALSKEMIDDISNIINKYAISERLTEVPYRIWLTGDNNQYIPTELYIDGIPNLLLEDMSKLYRRHGFICK